MAILFTVEDNSFNLLSNAVPSKLKSKVRIVNDSFFEPIGMLLSALLLFGLQSQSKKLGFILTLAALALALVMRALYSKAILVNIKDTALHVEKTLKDWLASMSRREHKEARKDIVDALNSSQEDIRLLACESLLSLQEAPALPQILKAARQFGTLSKIHLLRLLESSPFSSDERVLKAITGWVVESQSPEFSKWANFYLAKRGFPHLEKIEEDLEHPDLLMRGAAILSLRKSTRSYPSAPARLLANEQTDLLLASKNIDEISMGLDILAEDPSIRHEGQVFAFLSHPAILVKRSAARCFAKLADRTLSHRAPALLEQIKTARDNIFRLSCIEALGQLADASILKNLLIASVHFRPNERRRVEGLIVRMNADIGPALLAIIKDMSMPERGRILAGKILGRMDLPEIQEDFKALIKVEIDRAYFYFYFGHTIQKQYPKYNLEMLQNTLLTGFQISIDFIVHLLKTAGSLHEPELLVRALRSPNPKIHSHAIESLEKICHPGLFARIAPLIDDLPLEEKMAACLRHNKNLSRISLGELLIRLQSSPSLYDKAIAARLKAALQLPNWREELREQLRFSDPSFHHFAYELLET